MLGGGGTHVVGETGGEETHKLTVAEMPTHRHNVSYYADSGSYSDVMRSAGNGKSTKAFSSSSVGDGYPHNNMPPYYVLCYIMKL